MSGSDNRSSEPPKLCLNNCGFHGHASFGGYCSVCYKKLVATTPALGPSAAAPTPALDGNFSEGLGMSAAGAGVVSFASSNGKGSASLATPSRSTGGVSSSTTPSLPSASISSLLSGGLTTPVAIHSSAPSSATVPSSSATGATPAAGASISPIPVTPTGTTASLTTTPAAPSSTAATATDTMSSTPSSPAGATSATAPTTVPTTPVASTTATATAAGAADDKDGANGVQKNKGRCWSCKKKVGLTGFECRCGYTFCGTHRYADQHSCTFDYKTHDRSILERLNPQVTANKLERV